MSQIKDIMSTELILMSPDTTVEEAILILVQNRISGLPVLDSEGDLVGIITEFQLIEAMYDPKIKHMQVCELMTKNVLTLGPNDNVTKAADMMILQRIRRVPVVEGNKVVGIVSRHDLMRHIVSACSTLVS